MSEPWAKDQSRKLRKSLAREYEKNGFLPSHLYVKVLRNTLSPAFSRFLVRGRGIIMYEIKIIYGNWASSTYKFQTRAEIDAFQFGLREAQAQIPDCPDMTTTVNECHLPDNLSPWYQLLFSFFIGVWSIFWWYIFNGICIASEYLLVGMVATLISYVIILLFSWKRQKKHA